MKECLEWYIRERLPDLEDQRDYYENLNGLPEALYLAARGQLRNGNMDSHQYRVGYQNCKNGLVELQTKELEISQCHNFDQLFDITHKVAKDTKHLGDLWAYDTALRIGFYRKKYPKQVYIQAGVKKGTAKVISGGNWHKHRALAKSNFPDWISDKLEPYQIENFLCVCGKSRRRE